MIYKNNNRKKRSTTNNHNLTYIHVCISQTKLSLRNTNKINC